MLILMGLFTIGKQVVLAAVLVINRNSIRSQYNYCRKQSYMCVPGGRFRQQMRPNVVQRFITISKLLRDVGKIGKVAAAKREILPYGLQRRDSHHQGSSDLDL